MARTKTKDATPVLQRYVFQGLVVGVATLVDTEDTEFATKQQVGHERLRPIKGHDIESTGTDHPTCRCPVYEGMTVDALMRLGAGCTEGNIGAVGYVCPRLVRLRRMYGH